MSETLVRDDKAAWVERVLGVRFSESQPTQSQARAQEAAREIAVGLGAMSLAFRKARLSWSGARSAARGSIQRLQAELRAVLKDDPDFPAMDTAIGSIGTAMDALDDRLDGALDAAMQATDRGRQAELKEEALRIIAEYRGYVDGSTVLARIDTNPFMPLPVHAVLSGELQAMATELGK